MKKVIALATLMSVSFAQAQSNKDVSFGDLNYLFKSGEFNILADISLDRSEWKDAPAVGAKTTSESEGYVVETRFTYGLADKLNVFLGLDYAWQFEFNTEPRSANKNYYEDGLRNPELGAVYRLLDQKDSGFNWDIGVSGKFALMDAERGSFGGGDSKDGNASVGNHSLDLNTSIGNKWNEANEWRLSAGVIHNFAGEYTENTSAGDVDYDTEAVQDYYFRAAYQYRPVYEFMMAFAVQGTMVGEREEESTNQPVKTTTEFDSHFNLKFDFTAKYLILENFMARFNYAQSRLDDISVTSGNVESDINRRRHHSFGLGIDYLF